MLLVLITAAACTTPEDLVVDRVVDRVRGDDGGDGQKRADAFFAASEVYEDAMASFSNAPTTGGGVLQRALQELMQLRTAFDRWSQLVDDVVDLDPDGLPREELVAYRDASRRWIEAQEAITLAALRCGGDVRCFERIQSTHTPGVYEATVKVREAKLAFQAALHG